MMKIKKKFSIVFSFIIAAVLLYLILRQVGIEDFKEYLKKINYLWIIAAVILYTFDMTIRAYRWREILKDNNISIKLWESFEAYNLGNALNIIIPAKIGDIARSYYLKRKYSFEYSKTLPATFLDRFFDVIGVYIVILITSIYVISRIKMPVWFFDLILLGVVCLFFAFLIIGYSIKRKDKLYSIKNKNISHFIISLIDVFEGSIKNKIKFLKLVMCSVLVWLFEGLITITIFYSVGQTINPFVAIFTNMTATLTKIFPVTPGGIGVFEGTMVLVFSMFGIGKGIAGIVSTLNHMLMNIYTILVGVYVLIANGISVSKIKSEKVNEK